MLLTIIVFILILCVLVLIHEFGHYITAKILKIKVEEFGFGFPPRLIGKKIGETIYSINALPIGGFVKLYGEDSAGGGEFKIQNSKLKITKKEEKRAFFARPAWQRALVVVMGVIMNFILGELIISFLFGTSGMPKTGSGVLVVEVLKDSPAQLSGLKVGDIILSSGKYTFNNPQDLILYTKKHLGQKLELRIMNHESRKISILFITPRKHFPSNQGAMGVGISPNIINVKVPWYTAILLGFKEAAVDCWLIIEGIGETIRDLVVTRTAPAGLAGPVGIAQLTGQFIKIGPDAVLSLVSLLSLNLAVLNILPIPALDGGRFFFIIWEMITRKKVSAEFEGKVHGVGMIILLTLIILITIHDVTRLISGQPLLK